MFDRLAVIERQFEELVEKLGSAEIQSDPSEYRKHAKQLSEIEPIVERFREYKAVTRSVAETEELASWTCGSSPRPSSRRSWPGARRWSPS
jgi:peptide chain release factor 1